MNDHRIIWLVVNAASGSNDDAAVVALQQALVEAQRGPQRIIRVPNEPAPERADLEKCGVDLLVLFAGDGTANRSVTCLYGWAGDLLVLPGGTQNLLARSLHGDAPAEAIVAELAAGGLRTIKRSLVRCSAGDALVEIVAGPGAAWSDVRESLRDGAMADVAAATREAIGQSAAGPMVVVTEPPLGKSDGYSAVRIYPDGAGQLGVDGYGADGILDYARQGLALLRRDFREGPHDELGHHPAVVCHAAQPIELMIDGERATGGSEERFELADCDLSFLAGGGGHA